MSQFTDDLAITLALNIGGQAYSIPAGDIKSLQLDVFTWGFNGKLSFLVAVEGTTDKLFTPLTTKNDLIELTLQVETFVKDAKTTSTPLKLTGLVSRYSFSEQTLANVLPTQALMLNRHYHLVFADPAQVLWKQHYPYDLVVDTTLKALITAHTSAKIKLKYDWPALETVYPVLSLSLGADNNSASFYDFVLWLVDTQNGVFSYDCTTNQYTLSAKKSAEGKPKSLGALEVASFAIDFPEILRYAPNVLNSHSKTAKITAIKNPHAATPTRRDYLASYPIAADMQARVTLETARFKQRQHEVSVVYQKFQLQVTAPGALVNFKGSEAWNASLFNQPNVYRVKAWKSKADWVKQGVVPGYNCYAMELNLQLENSAELWLDLPFYIPPAYPFFVEGTIVSETGEETDATYQFYTDSKTSTHYYQTSIPLWSNKKIRTAYLPHLDTGQFYFPPYKNARVLIGLNFNTAFIAQFLDWGVGTALPLDSQGNQVVMGKSTTSQNSIKHTYVDSKPKLEIQRTEQKDTELMQFSEGYIILQTQTAE